jgi:hypothetical protein
VRYTGSAASASSSRSTSGHSRLSQAASGANVVRARSDLASAAHSPNARASPLRSVHIAVSGAPPAGSTNSAVTSQANS